MEKAFFAKNATADKTTETKSHAYVILAKTHLTSFPTGSGRKYLN